jgi:hypothetical protein
LIQLNDQSADISLFCEACHRVARWQQAWKLLHEATVTDPATLDYYRQRETQERALAARTIDLGIRRIHLELATRYADAVNNPDIVRPKLGIVLRGA